MHTCFIRHRARQRLAGLRHRQGERHSEKQRPSCFDYELSLTLLLTFLLCCSRLSVYNVFLIQEGEVETAASTANDTGRNLTGYQRCSTQMRLLALVHELLAAVVQLPAGAGSR